jgi:hypothetical protein
MKTAMQAKVETDPAEHATRRAGRKIVQAVHSAVSPEIQPK